MIKKIGNVLGRLSADVEHVANQFMEGYKDGYSNAKQRNQQFSEGCEQGSGNPEAHCDPRETLCLV